MCLYEQVTIGTCALLCHHDFLSYHHYTNTHVGTTLSHTVYEYLTHTNHHNPTTNAASAAPASNECTTMHDQCMTES